MRIGVAPASEAGMFEVQEVLVPDTDQGFDPTFRPLPNGMRFQASTMDGARDLAQVAAEQLEALGHEVRVL